MAIVQSANLGLPAAPLTDNSELYYELLRVYNAIRVVMQSVDNNTGAISPPKEYWNEIGFTRFTSGNASKLYLQAYENLTYGNTIAIHNAGGGVGKAKKAVTSGCIGFCSSVDPVTAGEYAEIQCYGIMAGFASGTLTPGGVYYQSGTAGVIGASGTQVVGVALSDTVLLFNPQY